MCYNMKEKIASKEIGFEDKRTVDTDKDKLVLA